MATGVTYEVCPETGIGCILVRLEDGQAKFDLMPDEVERLKQLAAAGDTEGIMALLDSISAAKAKALTDADLKALVEHAR